MVTMELKELKEQEVILELKELLVIMVTMELKELREQEVILELREP